jgi:hypothetical protein
VDEKLVHLICRIFRKLWPVFLPSIRTNALCFPLANVDQLCMNVGKKTFNLSTSFLDSYRNKAMAEVYRMANANYSEFNGISEAYKFIASQLMQ